MGLQGLAEFDQVGRAALFPCFRATNLGPIREMSIEVSGT